MGDGKGFAESYQGGLLVFGVLPNSRYGDVGPGQDKDLQAEIRKPE